MNRMKDLILGACLFTIILIVSSAGFLYLNFNGAFPDTYYLRREALLPIGKTPNVYFDTIKNKMTPVQFLDSLKCRKDACPAYCRVWGSTYGWVEKADLRILASRLASEHPCLNLMDMVSSRRVEKPTTEGEQAFLLIASYVTGRYPLYWYNPLEVEECLKREKVQFPPPKEWCVNRR